MFASVTCFFFSGVFSDISARPSVMLCLIHLIPQLSHLFPILISRRPFETTFDHFSCHWLFLNHQLFSSPVSYPSGLICHVLHVSHLLNVTGCTCFVSPCTCCTIFLFHNCFTPLNDIIFSVWRQIFQRKLSVSPYFLHYYQDSNEAGMLLVDKLSLKILGVYNFVIFWPKM